MCVLPAVAGPGLWGSPAVGVCVCYGAAPGGGEDPDVRDQEELLMRKKSSLLTVYGAQVTSDWQVLDCFFYIVILRLIKEFSGSSFSSKQKKMERNPLITE